MTDGGPAGRTELLWTLVARTAYSDARMGMANAMAYVSILLSIALHRLFLPQARRRAHADRCGVVMDEKPDVSPARSALRHRSLASACSWRC